DGLIRRLGTTGHVPVQYQHQKQGDGVHNRLLQQAQCIAILIYTSRNYLLTFDYCKNSSEGVP
ncbi:MAG TPA: hypothetical protein VHQ67_05775, partial [Nitrospiraceae bacterium]|nr:hypothetical protein [Nitrospiraceae bacterium]